MNRRLWLLIAGCLLFLCLAASLAVAVQPYGRLGYDITLGNTNLVGNVSLNSSTQGIELDIGEAAANGNGFFYHNHVHIQSLCQDGRGGCRPRILLVGLGHGFVFITRLDGSNIIEIK